MASCKYLKTNFSVDTSSVTTGGQEGTFGAQVKTG
jgi:hypothetical protein